MLLVISRIQSHQIAGKGPYRQSRRATSSRTLRWDYRVKMDEPQWLLAGEWPTICGRHVRFVMRSAKRVGDAYLARYPSHLAVDILRGTYVNSISLLGGRPMVGLQTLDLAIGVRVPASQPKSFSDFKRAPLVIKCRPWFQKLESAAF